MGRGVIWVKGLFVGRGYLGRVAICGEEYNVDKRGMGRISVGEGELKLWRRKSRFYKRWWGKNIKLYGTIYISAFKFEKNHP